MPFQLGGYSFSTYTQNRAVEQERTPCLQGGRGLAHLSTYAKSRYLQVFCNIFIFKVLLSYFVVFGVNIHNFFCKTFAIIIFPSQMFYSFFSMRLLIGCLKDSH